MTDSSNGPGFGSGMYQRLVEKRAEEALSDTPVVLIVGPRRAGKNGSSRFHLEINRYWISLRRFLQQTGDPVAAQQLALQALANLREQQASGLSYFDVFWVLAVVMAALVFVVPSMKRSVVEKGARIGGE